jgi:hypothetical protein
MRFRAAEASLIWIVAVTACATHHKRDAEETDHSPSLAASSRDDAGHARAPDAASRDIVMRQCGRPAFSVDWPLDENSPGISCLSHADCNAGPRGHCIGLADCAPPVPGEHCTPSPIRTTLCIYDDCATDADCKTGSQCVCPAQGGDPWCIKDGCDEDSDCPTGEHCRDDDRVQGVGLVQHCTTPADLCHSSADCHEPSTACGYDDEARHWACGAIFIIE